MFSIKILIIINYWCFSFRLPFSKSNKGAGGERSRGVAGTSGLNINRGGRSAASQLVTPGKLLLYSIIK